MAHTYVSNHVHVVFSTKNRSRIINSEILPRLHAFLGGIAKKHGMVPIAVGGTDDHVHVLLAIPAVMSIAKSVQIIKGVSSKWVHEMFSMRFAWQEAYGAFSVSASQLDKTAAYVRNQKQHHARRTFDAEFVALLRKHGVAYDPKYVFG